MQLAHFVRKSGLILVLVVACCVVGCGSGAEQGPTIQQKEAGESHRAGRKEFYEQLKADAKAQRSAIRHKGQAPKAPANSQ
jgi:hypothetical protein